MTQMDETGKLSRTTHVATSKPLPTEQSSGVPSMQELIGCRRKLRNITAPVLVRPQQRPESPVRKTRSEINPSPETDAYFMRQAQSLKGNGLIRPFDRWKETSSSTISDDMSAVPFKDENGNIQKLKGISMSTTEEKNKRYEDWLKKLDEVNVIPHSAKERVKKLEEKLYRLKKATEDNESQMVRAYRIRLSEDDESELIFPISSKTQTPEPQYQMKTISRTTQTDEISSSDVAINTEIDYRLMSALLDKLLVATSSVHVQTDWMNNVIETRDACVSTDRIFRQRFSALPQTRSMSAQTEVSDLKYKDESVSTYPGITGYRQRNRSLRESPTIRLSAGVQTDQKWISRKDVSCEANLSSFPSESQNSMFVSSSYPKGFHPKTGQFLDESVLPDYQEINDPNISRYGVRNRDHSFHRLSKTSEPIIEEYGNSSTSTSSESNLEGDYNCENVREIYREEFAEYKSKSNPLQKSYYRMSEEKKINIDFNEPKKRTKDRPVIETDIHHYDKEPHPHQFRHKFTANKRPDSRQEFYFKTPQIAPTLPPKPMPVMKSIETQTSSELMRVVEQPPAPKPVMKVAPKDLKTESKITVEVTKAHKKERSEVRSMTKMDEAGKMSRTTQVTTSKHVPIGLLSASPSMRELVGDRKTPTSVISPQRPMSPMRKAQSEINVTPVSNVSTRPSSVDDLSMNTTQSAPKIPSALSFGSSYPSRSSLKTPSPTFKHNSDDMTVPKVGRVSIQDPLHIVVLAPPERFDTKSVALKGNELIRPIDKSRWKETSSSTICNEMTTDAFKDEEGNIQKAKSISMSTETLIESKGNESSIKTRSRTARKYSNEPEEKAFTNETSFVGPGGLLKNDFPYIESEPTSRAFSPPHRTSSSPVVTLIDTPEFLSPEPPEPMTKSTRLTRSKENEIPSLVTDVRTSRYRPDEDLSKRLVKNTSRRAAVVEPVQQYSTVIKSDSSGMPATPQPAVSSPPTEIITRIIRTSELDESKKFRKSKTVFEQELQSGRDGGGCHISSSISFDNPSQQNRGVIIKELNEDGTSKDGSTDNLDQKSGELMTETNFQFFKTPKSGLNGCEETSWKYSVECNCINGSNTSVRTTIDYKRIKYPLTSYETSV